MCKNVCVKQVPSSLLILTKHFVCVCVCVRARACVCVLVVFVSFLCVGFIWWGGFVCLWEGLHDWYESEQCYYIDILIYRMKHNSVVIIFLSMSLELRPYWLRSDCPIGSLWQAYNLRKTFIAFKNTPWVWASTEMRTHYMTIYRPMPYPLGYKGLY